MKVVHGYIRQIFYGRGGGRTTRARDRVNGVIGVQSQRMELLIDGDFRFTRVLVNVTEERLIFGKFWEMV